MEITTEEELRNLLLLMGWDCNGKNTEGESSDRWFEIDLEGKSGYLDLNNAERADKSAKEEVLPYWALLDTTEFECDSIPELYQMIQSIMYGIGEQLPIEERS